MRPTLSIFAPLAILAATASGIHAQARPYPTLVDEDVRRSVAPSVAPVWVEAFVNRQRAPGQPSLPGWGGRIQWPLSTPTREGGADGAPRARLALGAFAIRSAPRGRLGAWHLGAQVDASPPTGVLAGRVEPLVSLAAGAYREELPGSRDADVPVVVLARPTDVARVPVRALQPPLTTTHAALSLGAALRIHLTPGIALRADARRVVVLDGGRRATELGLGVGVRR